MGKKDPVAVAKTQAANVMKTIQGIHIKSVGTVRNYEEALSRVAQYANRELNIGLREMTPEQAINYLEERGENVRQKTLDLERQAIQAMMHFNSKKLDINERITPIKSALATIEKSRSYTAEQVKMIVGSQQEQNALSTQIAYASGLRSHELFTLLPLSERAADTRKEKEKEAIQHKFSGRGGERYTVQGKGGLCREVEIPFHLAQQLEARRLEEPKLVNDRGVNYTQYYDIRGGRTWSSSFSGSSTRTLGWSSGGHGLRHSYAQERMYELQNSGMNRPLALKTVSLELGHFRAEITEVYLR
jgi:integrase